MHKGRIHDFRRIIKVADTEVDLQESRNAGSLYSVGVTTGAFTKEALEPYQPSFILDALAAPLHTKDHSVDPYLFALWEGK